jgi:hypothetical protein
MVPFRSAVEARDFDRLRDLLREDVVFRSPVAFKPYQGRDLVLAILQGVDRVFEGLEYVSELSNADAREHALVFQTRIGDVAVHGCDFLKLDEDGRIAELFVMVRPLSAANAVAEAMSVQFAAIQRELGLVK